MNVGDVLKIIHKDHYRCPFCNVGWDGGSRYPCGFRGKWANEDRNSMIVECICSNYENSCEIKSDVRHPCKCDLFSVLMVTGCKCGGY